MYKRVIIASFLLGYCSACSSPKNKQQNPHLQIKISGTGLANIKSEIVSKNKQEFLMFGDPAQIMFFRNSDTINYLFPIGKKDSTGGLDTTSVTRRETLLFNIKVSENKFSHSNTSTTSPFLRVELLADDKTVQLVQLPGRSKLVSKSVTSDSSATLMFQTSAL